MGVTKVVGMSANNSVVAIGLHLQSLTTDKSESPDDPARRDSGDSRPTAHIRGHCLTHGGSVEYSMIWMGRGICCE